MTKSLSAHTRRFGAEFIVIVLGVLSAFAVEGWSEQREDARLEQSYLVRLQEDLARDLQQIKRARWAAFANTRAATTLLYEIGDPLAADVPVMTESAQSIDFTVPATEVIAVDHLGDLVWMSYRYRVLQPNRGTYDEMTYTGRLIVIESDAVRAGIIDYYAFIASTGDIAEWIDEGTSKFQQVLNPTGLLAYEFQKVPEPIPRLKELDGIGFALRDLRWRAMRHVLQLEEIERRAKALSGMIDEHLTAT